PKFGFLVGAKGPGVGAVRVNMPPRTRKKAHELVEHQEFELDGNNSGFRPRPHPRWPSWSSGGELYSRVLGSTSRTNRCRQEVSSSQRRQWKSSHNQPDRQQQFSQRYHQWYDNRLQLQWQHLRTARRLWRGETSQQLPPRRSEETRP
ncbi:hypothetical protein Taro_011231, partial [Colocasia esculenta]|nr:hypothetical protein [Colocasia esculenta]